MRYGLAEGLLRRAVDRIGEQQRRLRQPDQLLQLRQRVVELVVAERDEVVADRVHRRHVGLALVLGRERRAVAVVADVDQPHGDAAPLLLGADLLHERRAPRDAADVGAHLQLTDRRSRRHQRRVAERQQVAVGVVGMEDGEPGRRGLGHGERRHDEHEQARRKEQSSSHTSPRSDIVRGKRGQVPFPVGWQNGPGPYCVMAPAMRSAIIVASS